MRDPFAGRPKSIAEVARIEGDRAAAGFREFLDEFYSEPDPEAAWNMLSEEPQLTGNPKADAWYAASAAWLSYRLDRDAPEWTTGHSRYLTRAWFPLGLESMKATLLVQSPGPFRERMIFVERDPLYRPRRDVPFERSIISEVTM